MRKAVQFVLGVMAILAFGVAMCWAQSGEATYKAQCQICHGAKGIPSAGMAKAMGVRPVTDPALKAETETQMITITIHGKGKMPGYQGKLNDMEIQGSVDYFRSLIK